MSRLSPTSLMTLRIPSTLILSLPKYSSAGATRTGGAFACAGSGFAVGFAAGTGGDSAAVVATATKETKARIVSTAILSITGKNGGSLAVDWSQVFVSARPRSVALLQLRAHDRDDFTIRWPEIRTRVAAAADAGAELIVLPEG